jgi:hypothetical protein
MIVVMVIIVGLLAAGGIVVYVSSSETPGSGYLAVARRSLYCAVAGLAAARPIVAANSAGWGSVIDADPSNDPPWHPIRGRLDPAATEDDFEVTILDNVDELPPAISDPQSDNDLRVFVVSRCLKYPEMPRTVVELLRVEAAGHNYRNQAGQGQNNTGNIN